MYLKKLELSGFKSFSAKASFEFPRGVTAIVGPNGSGKSNVVEAIRWVLGEQSFKNLRSKKGEDLIFAGTPKRQRASQASVLLHLDNSLGKTPVDYEDIIIGRKIFRSGEGEYFINQARVRLKDIEELLAKSLVNVKGHTIVSQGMADSFLNASADERGQILEGSFGLREYRLKKEEAERKLASAKNNIEKALSLVNEITPRLRYLKKQVKKIEAADEIIRELKELLKNWFSFRISEIESERENLSPQKDNAVKLIKSFNKEIEELKKFLDGEEKKFETSKEETDLKNKLEEFRDARMKLEWDLGKKEGEIESERKKPIVEPEYVSIDAKGLNSKLESISESLKKILSVESLSTIKDAIKKVLRDINFLLSDIKEKKPIENYGQESQALKKLLEEREELKKKVKDIQDKINESKEKIDKLTENEIARREEYFKKERELLEKEQEFFKVSDNKRRFEFEEEKMNLKESDLKEEMRRDGISLEEVISGFKGILEDDTAGKIQKLRAKKEEFGLVDKGVLEEYREVNERESYLIKESDDLKKSVLDLEGLIRKLNNEIETRFKDNFSKINEEFHRFFRMIFGGGKATLQIVVPKSRGQDKENLEMRHEEENKDSKESESKGNGVEIKAELPGKKLKGLETMSGGERALTSVALLFAMVAANPPPFLVVDEIDAALDEANSKRLADIFDDLSKKTQFIIVTHNRETMKRANVLYGVTMGEDGVSRLLSLSLDKS